MDGQQFDRLTKALGSGKSRRSLLKKLSAAGFGALLGSRFVESAAAQEGCLTEYSPCPVIGEVGECCEGLQCTEFWNAPEGQGLCFWIPTCSEEGTSCSELPCCNSMICTDDQICVYGVADYCAVEDEECGHGLVEGVVVPCCDGLICTPLGEGSLCYPDPDYCLQEDAICDGEGDAECCVGLVCNEYGHCTPPVTCIAEGDPCGGVTALAQDDCCDGLICIDSDGKGTTICGVPDEPKKPEKPEEPKTPEVPAVPVTRLPDTGAGIGDADASWVAPAVMGTAAAVLGGKVLQNMKASQDS